MHTPWSLLFASGNNILEIAARFGETALSVNCRIRKLRYAPCVADMCWPVADSSTTVVDS